MRLSARAAALGRSGSLFRYEPTKARPGATAPLPSVSEQRRIFRQETEPGEETFRLVVGMRIVQWLRRRGRDAAPDRGRD